MSRIPSIGIPPKANSPQDGKIQKAPNRRSIKSTNTTSNSIPTINTPRPHAREGTQPPRADSSNPTSNSEPVGKKP
ncbi:Unknown protein, partial [Striga hermonthica]